MYLFAYVDIYIIYYINYSLKTITNEIDERLVGVGTSQPKKHISGDDQHGAQKRGETMDSNPAIENVLETKPEDGILDECVCPSPHTSSKLLRLINNRHSRIELIHCTQGQKRSHLKSAVLESGRMRRDVGHGTTGC